MSADGRLWGTQVSRYRGGRMPAGSSEFQEGMEQPAAGNEDGFTDTWTVLDLAEH